MANTVKRQSTRAIAAAETRQVKREVAETAARLTVEQAEAAYFAAHKACVAAWVHKQAVQDAFGYTSDEAADARRAYVAADRAAMVARCVYATVKQQTRYR